MVGIVAAGLSFIPGAVFLGILNIYLAGHGIDWPSQDFESGPVGMSPLSVALGVFVATVFVAAFLIVLFANRGSKSSDSAGTPE